MSTARILALVVALAFGLALAATAAAQRPGLENWQAELENVDHELRKGKWKAGKRAARRLAEEVLYQGWHDRKLGRILAEIACYQAAAAANLDQRDEAVWYWHIAQNLYPKIRDKDLAPYGDAGKLLREFLLRKRGEAPARFRVARPGYGKNFHHPMPKDDWAPVIPRNAGAKQEGVGDLKVELIVDRHGRPHHPVLISTYLHPVIVYSALESLRTLPAFEPATDDGEPVDSFFEFTTRIQFSRWDQGGKTLGGRIQNRL